MSDKKSLYGIGDEPDDRQRDLAIALDTRHPTILWSDKASGVDFVVEIEGQRNPDGSIRTNPSIPPKTP